MALAALPAAASAQYIGGSPPAPPPPPAAGTLESSEAALARNVRLLAINPRNYDALLGAGRAALRLGDAQAAVGFFGRAEEVNSAHWAPKAGQGAALAQMGEGAAALGMFEQAQRLGATQNLIALDRGLAFDLLGRQAEAQADYRAVLPGPDQVEAQRRLALSLAISGRKPDALAVLDPLIGRRDPGARRTRAFILALGGDVDGARAAIGAIMPGASNGFDPFLRRLASLGPGQKAAAVHLGMMPAEGTALAALEPVGPAPVQRTPEPMRVAAVTPRRAEPRPNASRLADIESTLSQLPATTPTVGPPPPPRPIVERAAQRRPVAPERRLASRPATTESSTARSSEPEERPQSSRRRPEEQGLTRSAARDRPREGAATARRGAAEERKEQAVGSGRVYVQLAGGQNAERMDREFTRIRARKAALFRGRQPLVSEVRGWARLLVGPFKDQETAQEFVNELHEAKLEGFVWTAPSGTKFEKLAAK
jgi:tetratricopeptide (TPR) repeat protein